LSVESMIFRLTFVHENAPASLPRQVKEGLRGWSVRPRVLAPTAPSPSSSQEATAAQRLTMPLVFFVALVFFLRGPAPLQAATLTTTETLQAAITPLGGLFTVPSSMTLAQSGTAFAPFTGSVSIQYRARTTQSTGGGNITLKATADFSPAGGPSIASPPTAGDVLQYTCSGATLGTGCSGLQTVKTTAATNVVTLAPSECSGGGSPCSSADPNTVTLNFGLTNDPKYKTASSYSATLTFTISAT